LRVRKFGFEFTEVSASLYPTKLYQLSAAVHNFTEIIQGYNLQRLYSPGWALTLASSSKCRLYNGLPSANFYDAVSLPLPLPAQSIRSSRLVHNTVLGNWLPPIHTKWLTHLNLLDFITLTIFGSL
jgi:hypothetical protein